MRHPLIRQGEGPTAALERIHHERKQLRCTLDRIRAECAPTTEHTSTTLSRGTAPGDERKLRGIPVQAKGVPGHIPGTRP